MEDELATLLRDSGCCYVNVGFESVTQECLDDFRKNTTVTDNYTTARLMKKHGVPLGINFIWGIMSDTAETLRKSVDFIKEFQSYNELRTIRPITPFPGCELYDYAIRKGLLSGPEDFFNRFRNSDLLTVNFTSIPDEEFYRFPRPGRGLRERPGLDRQMRYPGDGSGPGVNISEERKRE